MVRSATWISATWILAASVTAPLLAQAPDAQPSPAHVAVARAGSLPALIARADAAEPVAKEFRELRLDADGVYDSVRDVVKTMRWHSRLKDAQRAAADAQRPVFWVHALGELKGYT